MTGDRERPFLGQRSIGGPYPRLAPDSPERKVWIDTGSGPGIEVPASEAYRFTVPPFPTGTLSGARAPDTVPPTIPEDVQADALRATIRRHMPTTEGVCRCGALLGQESGLCRGARLAIERLMRLADEAERRELATEAERYLPPADD